MSKEVRVSLNTRFQAQVSARGHAWLADEPAEAGGDDKAPTPYELFLGALGACSAITMRMYAQRKGWPLDEVEVRIGYERVHADDCVECEKREGRSHIDVVTKRIILHGDLSEEQRARIAEIGGRCPVQRTVQSGPHFIEEVALQ